MRFGGNFASIHPMRLLVCVTFWGCLAFFAASGLYAIYIQNDAPVVVTGLSSQIGQAQPGGLLSIKVEFQRTRDCPVDTGIYLLRDVVIDGEARTQRVLLDSSTTVAVDVTGDLPQKAVLSWFLPAGTPPGEWTLNVKSVDRCNLLNMIFPPIPRHLRTNIIIQPTP